jgi:hypothetical protein
MTLGYQKYIKMISDATWDAIPSFNLGNTFIYCYSYPCLNLCLYHLGKPLKKVKPKRKSPKKRNVETLLPDSLAEMAVEVVERNDLQTEDVNMDEEANAQDSAVIESVNNLIFDPTEALLPPSWRWLSDCDAYQSDDPTAQNKIAVRYGNVNNATIVIKSITIIGNEVFYRVMGKLVPSPKILPQFIPKVEDITNLTSHFESSSVCMGFGFDINN